MCLWLLLVDLLVAAAVAVCRVVAVAAVDTGSINPSVAEAASVANAAAAGVG
jgi:hypothetical protein